MDLTPFGHFFEFFATLCFAFAGSKTFRAAFNDTILKIGVSLDAIKKAIDIQKAKLVVEQSEVALAVQANELNDKIRKFKELEKEEGDFRSFPEGLKSSFLITGMFCLAVILLGGYSQFFECSQVTHVILTFLNFVIFYNIFVFLRSFRKKNCHKNIKTFYPVLTFFLLAGMALFYVSAVSWIGLHAHSHDACTGGPGLFTLDTAGNINQVILCDDRNRFRPHSRLDERWMITLALLTAMSPFLLHFARVVHHKLKYKPKFQEIEKGFNRDTERAHETDDLMAEINRMRAENTANPDASGTGPETGAEDVVTAAEPSDRAEDEDGEFPHGI